MRISKGREPRYERSAAVLDDAVDIPLVGSIDSDYRIAALFGPAGPDIQLLLEDLGNECDVSVGPDDDSSTGLDMLGTIRPRCARHVDESLNHTDRVSAPDRSRLQDRSTDGDRCGRCVLHDGSAG